MMCVGLFLCLLCVVGGQTRVFPPSPLVFCVLNYCVCLQDELLAEFEEMEAEDADAQLLNVPSVPATHIAAAPAPVAAAPAPAPAVAAGAFPDAPTTAPTAAAGGADADELAALAELEAMMA